MDLRYLHILQDFRIDTNEVLTPFMEFVSGIAVSSLMFILIAVVYWGINKKTGRWLVLCLTFGRFVINAVIKLTACVYRPWIKDPTIIPSGNAIASATGYSFPSGHSSCAAFSAGAMGVLFAEKKKTILAIVMFLYVLLVMFSRNYLGVHTPQDVIVGAGVTLAIVIAAKPVNEFLEIENSDIIFLVISFALCILCVIYIENKSYPMDYIDGELIVDPQRMIPDGYWGIGALTAASLGNLIDRRWIRYDCKAKGIVDWIIIAVLLIPVHMLYTNSLGLFAGYNKRVIRFWTCFASVFYIMVVAPLIIKLINGITKQNMKMSAKR